MLNKFKVLAKKSFNAVKFMLQKLNYNALAKNNKVINIPVVGLNDNGLKFIEDKKLLKRSFPGEVINEFPESIQNYDELKDKSLKRRGLVQHFNEGLPWEETDLFIKRYKKELKTKNKRGCDNLSDLAKVYENEIDTLYSDIKNNGFKSPNDYSSIDPIYIHIGPKGELIWTSNGNHRFYIAEILNLEFIPVKVWWRHIDWQLARENAYKLGKNDFVKKYPQYSLHPDLQDIL